MDDFALSAARVLIVEDSAVEAMLLERVISDLGYGVIGAVPSGEQAIAAARGEKPDVVLMDVDLQGPMSGVEAAEAILTEHDAQIVFLTAYGDLETRQRMWRIAGSAVLGKPFTERILELTLRQLLSDRARRSSEAYATEDAAEPPSGGRPSGRSR